MNIFIEVAILLVIMGMWYIFLRIYVRKFANKIAEIIKMKYRRGNCSKKTNKKGEEE